MVFITQHQVFHSFQYSLKERQTKTSLTFQYSKYIWLHFLPDSAAKQGI